MICSPLVLSAPAKLNLSLAVTGKRRDGYHLLQSVMQSIALYDQVELQATPGPEPVQVALSCSIPELPTGQENVAVQAALAFCRQARPGFAKIQIHLKKGIPFQAGLGGASADGAAVLRGLNRLSKTPLSSEELGRLAASIGADLPFCLQGGCCLAQGIGEQLTLLPPVHGGWFVLIKPPFGCSTPEVFSRYDQLPPPPSYDLAPQLDALTKGDLTALGPTLFNGLTQAAGRKELLEGIKFLLTRGALGSCMTGSGSTVFGLFGEEPLARQAAADAEKSGLGQVFCVPEAPGTAWQC